MLQNLGVESLFLYTKFRIFLSIYLKKYFSNTFIIHFVTVDKENVN